MRMPGAKAAAFRAGGNLKPQPGGYIGGRANPFNWGRWALTGNANAPDENYQAAYEQLGAHVDENYVPVASAAVDGLKTGGKAIVNGAGTAVRSTLTLGLVGDHWEIIEVSAEDRARGYDAAAGVIQISGEFIIGAASGGAAAALAKGGRLAVVAGKGLVLFDAAGNAVGVVTSTKNMIANGGPDAQNMLKLLASGAGLGGNVAGLKAFPNCFPANTVVATEHGPKAIQEVLPSERVWSFDLAANEWKLRHVVETYRHEHSGDMVAVSVAGETIESTGHHPWWVVRGVALGDRPRPEHVPDNPPGFRGEGRWVDAIDLRVGDVLLLRSGEQAPLTRLAVRDAHEATYNFHVEDLQCYAVGDARILVHNNSKALGKSLEANVRPRLPGEKAAHLVPAGNWSNTNRSQLVKDAIANAQAKLKALLLEGIDGYYNGFWAKQASHAGTHTDAYFVKMWELLKDAMTENEVVSALAQLRQMVQKGAFNTGAVP